MRSVAVLAEDPDRCLRVEGPVSISKAEDREVRRERGFDVAESERSTSGPTGRRVRDETIQAGDLTIRRWQSVRPLSMEAYSLGSARGGWSRMEVVEIFSRAGHSGANRTLTGQRRRQTSLPVAKPVLWRKNRLTASLAVWVIGVVCLGSLPLAGSPGGAAAHLKDLFRREWEFRLREDPLLATSVGRHEYDDRLPQVEGGHQKKRAAIWEKFLQELDTIPRQRLSESDAVSADIFRRQLEDAVAEIRFGAFQIPLNADSGFQTDFARLPDDMPFETVHDYDNYAARLRAFPSYVDQQIGNMRQGMARGMTLPAAVTAGLDDGIAAQVVEDPEKSGFFQPYRTFPPGVPRDRQDRLRQAGRRAVLEGAVAGYRNFLRFLVDEYVPGCRKSLAATDLPDGRAYYQQQIRHFTTLDLQPKEIHATGVREVKRIHAEMMKIIKELGFQGSFAEFLHFLRTDPRFYATSAEELLKEAAYIAKRMDGQLPALFRTLPRLPYTVAPVPAALAPKYTAGRYISAPHGSRHAGTYWVNTYALNSRPLYALQALTLHEAVPGHHLQVALNNEIEDLPPFRRFSYISAFGEGWGLYSEWLGLEAGFYKDPYSDFGRLTYEIWRACRLVVDTGIHAMGWTRRQAMDYLASHTALSLREVETETDRYISWPAQALSYKLGQLKISALRREAEKRLGERFDVRDFHTAVLQNGSVPLDVLTRQVRAWMEAAAGP